MRRRVALGSTLVAILMLGMAFGDDFKSGLQVGDAAPAFNVRNITGQDSAIDYAKDGRGSLCYR
jgi:hypothetical protein